MEQLNDADLRDLGELLHLWRLVKYNGLNNRRGVWDTYEKELAKLGNSLTDQQKRDGIVATRNQRIAALDFNIFTQALFHTLNSCIERKDPLPEQKKLRAVWAEDMSMRRMSQSEYKTWWVDDYMRKHPGADVDQVTCEFEELWNSVWLINPRSKQIDVQSITAISEGRSAIGHQWSQLQHAPGNRPGPAD